MLLEFVDLVSVTSIQQLVESRVAFLLYLRLATGLIMLHPSTNKMTLSNRLYKIFGEFLNFAKLHQPKFSQKSKVDSEEFYKNQFGTPRISTGISGYQLHYVLV